MREVL